MADAEYESIEKLGVGCFGEVIKVKRRSDGEIFAAKILKLESKDMKREISSLEKIGQHPNIVQLLKPVENGAEVWLIYEYCPEGTLNDYIIKKSVPLNEKKDYMREIMSAVAHIHSHKILHLDLKADNILLKRQNSKLKAKVTDFGIAQIFSSSKNRPASTYNYPNYSSSNCMPMKFIPKECQQDFRAMSFYTDVYQAGCTFLGMVLEITKKWGPKQLLVPCDGDEELHELDAADRDNLYNRVEDPALSHLLKQMTDDVPAKRPAAKDIKI